MRVIAIILGLVSLTACKEEELASEPLVRGLKTHLIQDTKDSTVRRFPAVLEPTSLNTLSFEVAGKLQAVDLEVGQRVEAGQPLISLDTTAFQIQLDNAIAGVLAAQATRDNAADNLTRQQNLFARGSTTKVARDNAQAEAISSEARLEQAKKSRDSAQENLSKTSIISPIDGVINAVDAVSFSTVSPGVPMVSLYAPDAFEISFSVNFETATQLVVGTPATIRLADLPDVSLNAVVTELGARADAVSSFPVVLSLQDNDPILKAGMAVEASIELPLPAAQGFTIPLSAILKKGQIGFSADRPQGPGKAQVFVYDAVTETVLERDVSIGGVRENAVLVVEGLDLGDRVASAGVSFLSDGMKVNLIDEN
ncbi:efflux RND transporter periplasmic adaptor subunit [Ruegeria sp. THAF33]|uniref:efflux RND transporter periplasmic adaptor subunit n=1 Tax=Ruegeria sp. THAF33 TaxID=2587853 RepID=UPI0012686613|nr:efflux RND transporter periplasmic adaptor subunit [Ruegeria sp. THAF33]QFT75746.1 Multidrug resistance protein MdtA precursor [Ruegeria sp. THAF33]